jgi:hypothetical protein
MRICVLAAVTVVAMPRAHAEPDRAGTQAAMNDYFAGEKRGGYVLAGLGIGGLVAGGLLYRADSELAKGASYPLLGLGLAHLAAGLFVNLSSNRRIDKFGAQIAADPTVFVKAERRRMAGVSKQFAVLEVVEVIGIAGGLAMIGIGAQTDRPRLEGAGITLAAELAVTLGFDIIAGRRAHGYRRELDVQAGVDPLTHAPTAFVVHTRSF